MRKAKIIFYSAVLVVSVAISASCKKHQATVSYNADKSSLEKTIDSLTAVMNSTAEGTKPGQYAIGAKTPLSTAISLALQVDSTQNMYTQQEVNNALNNLLLAGKTYNTQLLQEVSVANLVAFWKFNGNAVDSSGNGHDGMLSSGYIGSSATTAVDGGTLPQLVDDRFGRHNMAYSFNNGATVEVPYSGALNPQNFTISLWVNHPTTNPNNYMVSLDRWNGFKFQLQGNDFLFLTIHTSDGNYHDQDDNPGAIPVNVWTHAAVSYTNGTMKFYINGALVKTASVSGTPITLASPVNLAIGNELPKSGYNLTDANDPNYFYGADFFVGSLDDIRLYNTVLTDAEILSIYTDESTP